MPSFNADSHSCDPRNWNLGLFVHLRTMPWPTNSRTTENPCDVTWRSTVPQISNSRCPAASDHRQFDDSRVTSISFRASAEISPTGT